MSATFSPRCARQTERLVEVSVLPVPPFGPRTQTSREFSVMSGVVRALLAGEQLVDLEADLLRRRREHDDVVCAGLERAPEEAVGRPVPENHDVQVGVLAGHPVQEQQGAVRVAGAGDEQQIGDAAAQPAHRLVGAGDDSDDVEVLAAGQRVLHVLGVDAWLDCEECLYRAARHQWHSFYLSTVDASSPCDGLVGLAPTTGRRTKISCVLSAAYNHVAASLVSIRRMRLPPPLGPGIVGIVSTFTLGRKSFTTPATEV